MHREVLEYEGGSVRTCTGKQEDMQRSVRPCTGKCEDMHREVLYQDMQRSVRAGTGKCKDMHMEVLRNRTYGLIVIKFQRTEFWHGPRIFLELSVRLPEPPVRRLEQYLLACVWSVQPTRAACAIAKATFLSRFQQIRATGAISDWTGAALWSSRASYWTIGAASLQCTSVQSENLQLFRWPVPAMNCMPRKKIHTK